MVYKLTDTHCHITCDDLFERIDDVLRNAKEHHVGRMMIVCTSFKEFERARELKKKDPNLFDIALGFHPNDLYKFNEKDYVRLESLLQHKELAALGEIGLDYHWDDVKREDQIQGFIRQIELAKTYQVPILIHMREATKDTLDILKEHGPITGIFHCYSGSYETALEAMKLGFYIAYGGPLTFKNSRGAPEVAAKLPIDRLFVETDSPYLTPHPYRGKQNEPMYVDVTFKRLCEIKNVNEEILAKQLEENYQCLFNKSLNFTTDTI